MEGDQRTESQSITSERHRLILQKASHERVVRVKSLAEQMGVHEMTIRRDLDYLCDLGLMQREHGGAVLLQQVATEVSYQLRAGQNIEAKQRIAQLARSLIQPGDTIALDASTTSLALAQCLTGDAVTAVVTGLDAANTLATSGVPFLLTGGSFHDKARSFTGGWVAANLSRTRVDRVFFSSKGMSISAGFTDAHPAEADSKEWLIGSGRQIIALIDSSKFGIEALCQIAPLKNVHVVITEVAPPDDYRAALDKAHIQLLIAEDKS